jgi:hypothetical protein
MVTAAGDDSRILLFLSAGAREVAPACAVPFLQSETGRVDYDVGVVTVTDWLPSVNDGANRFFTVPKLDEDALFVWQAVASGQQPDETRVFVQRPCLFGIGADWNC